MRKAWFQSTPELDNLIRERYEAVVQQALAGELNHWQDTACTSLALCIVLDQFPLNIYRGTVQSFAGQEPAIAVARHAIREGLDKQLDKSQLAFLYLPLMHSEDLVDQDLCVEKFAEAGLEENLKFARHHRDIVRRFGRFPHRNVILGRQSRPEERAYLDSPEAFKG